MTCSTFGALVFTNMPDAITNNFRELQQPNTPPLVRQWAASLPTWIAVQTPKTVNLALDVDAGELEAICLAQEIHADAVLMDDRAGRNAAIHCGLAVVCLLEHGAFTGAGITA